MSDRGQRSPEIVFLVSDYFPARGGTTTQTKLHAQEFLRRGWSVTVLTRRVRQSRSQETIDGVTVRRVALPGRGRVAKGLDLLASWLWLARRRRTLTAVSIMMDADFALAARAAGLGSSEVLTWVTRGDATRLLSGPAGRLRIRLLATCKQVVLTPRMKDELGQLGVDDVSIIPVPVDMERFREPLESEKASARQLLGLPDGSIVLFVGHLQERKGVDLLIQAFRLVLDVVPTAQLVLVGGAVEAADHEYVRMLKQSVIDSGIGEAVHFSGAQDDVAPFMFSADIFCLASHREGMPNVLLEAMACGLPCVAPASAGGDELLFDSAGVIPPSNSPADLAGALIPLLADEESRRTLGAAGLARVRARNQPSEVADAYERLL